MRQQVTTVWVAADSSGLKLFHHKYWYATQITADAIDKAILKALIFTIDQVARWKRGAQHITVEYCSSRPSRTRDHKQPRKALMMLTVAQAFQASHLPAKFDYSTIILYCNHDGAS